MGRIKITSCLAGEASLPLSPEYVKSSINSHMKYLSNTKYFSAPQVWRIILICVIGLGALGRWIDIDAAIYWYDEAFTSLRASGYTEAQAVATSSTAGLLTNQELYTFQQPAPTLTIQHTLASLAHEDPQHPPLYYVLAYYWMRGFGDSIVAMRSLTALISLLVIPCIYWFTWELFQQPRIAWIASALAAVSPTHLLYAREAREYSLWAVTILLASTGLLRALRMPTTRNWVFYALFLALALNTFPLSLTMMVGHGLYVLSYYRLRFVPIVKQYCLASGVGLLTFLPWMWVIVTRFDRLQSSTSWTGLPFGRLDLLRSWRTVLGYIFIGIDHYFYHWAIAVIVAIAIGHLILRQERQTRWMVLLLIAVPFGFLALPDLLLDGGRSTVSRYLMPTILGIQIIVAHWLGYSQTHGFSLFTCKLRLSWFKTLVLTALLVGSFYSLTQTLPARTSWVKDLYGCQPEVAAVVNAAPRPLVVSDADMADVLSLSHYFKPQVHWQVRPHCWTCNLNEMERYIPFLPEIPTGFDTVFFYKPRPTQAWLQAFKQQTDGQWQPVRDGQIGLWQRSE